MILKVTDNKYV